MKKEEARPLNKSEREELIRLRAENEYIKAENEVIKKEIAKAVDGYINYYNNERIQEKTKWMPPTKFREASMCT